MYTPLVSLIHNPKSNNNLKKDKVVSSSQSIKSCRTNGIGSKIADYKAYNYMALPFRGAHNKLCSRFSESNSSKIYQFLCETQDKTQTEVREFLDYIMSNDSHSQNFIKEITSNPKKSAEISLNLANKLGGTENFRDWYFAPNGYRENVGKFIGNYYEHAKNIDEMLSFMPNWKLSDIVAKFHKSQTGNVFEGSDPLIGKIPEEFKNYFPKIINTLRNKSSNHGEIPIGQQKLCYHVLKDSDEKLVTQLTTEQNKNYIIKLDKKYSDYIYSRIRANSIFLEALLGKYLTMNNCKNTPKFYFYDFFHNASVFEYINGKSLTKELNPLEMNKLTPDLLALGVRVNDTHQSNYIQTNDGIFNIDLGNATWFDGLKPGDITHSINFPNNTGLDISNSYNLLDFAKFIRG